MAQRLAPFYDLTLCIDGSIGVRYLCQVVDDDGKRIGAAVPHRLIVQPDEDIATKTEMQHAALAVQVDEDGTTPNGFTVPDQAAVVSYLAGCQSRHWANPLVTTGRSAWLQAKESARAAREDAERAIKGAADAAEAERQAQADAGERAANEALERRIADRVEKALAKTGG